MRNSISSTLSPPRVLDTSDFWTANQPGFRFTEHLAGTPEFFAAIERHRYRLEPHIHEVVGFASWYGKDVLEFGCGIATDGIQFARAGARYIGLDQSEQALSLARTRFELEGHAGEFVPIHDAELPVPSGSVDLVFSHGVLHHIPDPSHAIREFHRVLRPGGTVLVMLYHRASLNYRLSIMILRRAGVFLLLLPGFDRLVAQATGEKASLLRRHRELLEEHGLRYVSDRSLFLSNNTDGPGNPYSAAYTRGQAQALFRDFVDVRTHVRYLNLRIVPGGRRFAHTHLSRSLERRLGWHLYVSAVKPRLTCP